MRQNEHSKPGFLLTFMDLYSGGLFVPVKSQQSLQTPVSTTEKCVWGVQDKTWQVVLFWALAKWLSPKLEKNTEHFFLIIFPLFVFWHCVIILHCLLQNHCIKMSVRASKALTYCSYLKVWVALQAGKVHYSHQWTAHLYQQGFFFNANVLECAKYCSYFRPVAWLSSFVFRRSESKADMKS